MAASIRSLPNSSRQHDREQGRVTPPNSRAVRRIGSNERAEPAWREYYPCECS